MTCSLTRRLLTVGFLVACLASPAAAVPVKDGLSLWLDATDGATLFQDVDMTQSAGFGDYVGGWLDKSGNDYQAFQLDDAFRPTLEADVVGGKPALRFDGPQGVGLEISEDLMVERPYTIFLVEQFYGVIGRTLQGDSQNWLLGGWGASVTTFAGGFVGTTPASPNIVYAVDATGTPTGDSTLFVNKANLTNDPTPTGAPSRLALVSSGAFAAEGAQAYISELAVYDRVLSGDELTSVRNYFYQKYNVQELVPDMGAPLNTVLAGNLGVFTGGDPGEGLDLEGDFAYAVNVGGPETAVGDLVFSDGTIAGAGTVPGVTIMANQEIAGWHSAEYGDSDLDNGVEEVMRSIRHSGTNVDLEVEPNTMYKLQLMFAESCCDRGFDITVDDTLFVDNLGILELQGGMSTSQGVVFSHTFVAQDDVMNIVLGGKNPRTPDNNPILNALTLERVGITGDFNANGALDAGDIDILSAEVRSGLNTPAYDLTADALVNEADREQWVNVLKHTYMGDANLDGEFNSTDFVDVFVAGKYEDAIAGNAGWAEGDWDGSADFDSSDFVLAFVNGGYEIGPRASVSAVPEPASLSGWLALVLAGLAGSFRRRSSPDKP